MRCRRGGAAAFVADVDLDGRAALRVRQHHGVAGPVTLLLDRGEGVNDLFIGVGPQARWFPRGAVDDDAP